MVAIAEASERRGLPEGKGSRPVLRSPLPRQGEGGTPGVARCPKFHKEGYIPFIASHDTVGFMSAKAPVGFCFQAQTCNS